MAEQSEKVTAPCGSWPSPITPELAANAAGTLDYPIADGDYLYWIESRPEDKGRNTIMRTRRPPFSDAEPLANSRLLADIEGIIEDLLPSPLNVRSRVHEYGGQPYTVKNGILYFVLQDDQRIYQLDTNAPKTLSQPLPQPLTPADQGLRFAELCIDTQHQRLIAVCEQHSINQQDKPSEPENFIAAIPLDGSQTLNKLVTGADFYAYPRLSPDDSQLAWISWQHPDMPWDNTCLKVADIDNNPTNYGALCNTQTFASSNNESIVQPNWSPDGRLFFVSDRSEWWNIYCLDTNHLDTNHLDTHSSNNSTSDQSSDNTTGTPLYPMEAEFATPLWTLGMSNYGIGLSCLNDNGTHTQHLIASYTQDGLWYLGRLVIPGDASSSLEPTPRPVLETIPTPYAQLSSLTVTGNRAWFIGSSTQRGSELVELDIATQKMEVLRQVAVPELDPKHFSQPQVLRYPTTHQHTAHGFYYPPTHPEYSPLKTETPPLIALCHGGPTGATSTALSYKVQFWTNRGFAVADFNYRGSTGFGRPYRDQLKGNWGRSDIDDVVAGVSYLCEQGLADPERLLIRGSSAGAYTVLAALTFTDMFRAGASLYGIGDLETLARDTHKFEARYLDSLVGPYPDARQTYIERSPIHHAEQLNCPVIFFQGLEDKVVPPNQALAMVNALKAKGLEVVYVPFAGEGHGFRRAENVARVFREELAFYQNILSIPTTP